MLGSLQAQTSLTASWNPNPEPDIAGYIVHLGTSSRNYSLVTDVVEGTSVVLTGLTPSTTYYCAVQAYNTSGMMSEMSDEVSRTTAPANAPEIEVRVAESRTLSAGTDSVKFVDSNRTKTFTITNRGNAGLDGLSVSLSGLHAADFALAGPDTQSLAPGGSTTFKVAFKTRIFARRRWATLRIASNDPDTNPFDITLNGKGAGSTSGKPHPPRKSPPGSTDTGENRDRAIKSAMIIDGRRFLCISIPKTNGSTVNPRDVEVSANLVDWSSGRNHTTVVTDNATMLKVRDNTPLTPGSKRYIRLRKRR
jgi:hypothetical protein